MFNKIVLAVDGSDNGARATQAAAELAKTFEAHLLVVHAYEPVPRWMGEPSASQQTQRLIAAGEALLDAALERLEAIGVPDAQADLLEGPAPLAITNAARAHDADLIVMGTRGLTPIQGLLMGSVSERVIGLAPCPVLIVR